jgi:hypothetical protein
MKKIVKEEHNGLDLLLMGFNKTPYIYMKENESNAYRVKEKHYLSYEKELTVEEIQHIIRLDIRDMINNIIPPARPSAFTELIATYFFKHIDIGDEAEAIFVLLAIEENRDIDCDIWGVLDDGSILNPNLTQPYLYNFSGNKYNESTIQRYNLDTEQIEEE